MKEYLLKFNDLETGKHEFDYLVSEEFFKNFEDSPAESGDLEIKVELEKAPMVLTLNFNIQGNVNVACDRCLDLINLDVNSENTLFVKFGDETTDITDVDQVMVLDNSATELDLSQHIYEYICLSIPFRVTHDDHSDSDCNQEMLDKLSEYLITEKTDEEKSDPRWDALKAFKN